MLYIMGNGVHNSIVVAVGEFVDRMTHEYFEVSNGIPGPINSTGTIGQLRRPVTEC